MTSALLVIVIFLAVLTFGNLFLLFAVIRRLRTVQELAVPAIPVPDIGTEVQPFRVDTISGAEFATDQLTGAPFLLAVLSNSCPACKAMAPDIAALASSQPEAPVVLIAGSPQHDSSELLTSLAGLERVAFVGIDDPILLGLGGIQAFPTVLAISDGKIAGSGTSLERVLPALRERRKVAAR